MTESEHPLLTDEPGAKSKKTTKRRTTAKATANSTPEKVVKPAAVVTATVEAKPRATKPAKARATTATRKKKAAEVDESPELPMSIEPEPAPVKTKAKTSRTTKAAAAEAPATPAPTPAPAPVPVPAPPTALSAVHSAVGEEWSPSRRKTSPRGKAAQPESKAAQAESKAAAPTESKPAQAEAKAAQPAKTDAPAPKSHTPKTNGSHAPAVEAPAAPAPAAEAAVPTAPAAPAPTPAAPAGSMARKYPVYVPRHVAKQMEQQGQQAPIAVPADAVPEVVRVAVEAAAASAPPSRHERHERQQRQPQHQSQSQPQERHHQEDSRHAEPAPEEDLGTSEGIVEISGKGFGFIRDPKRGFAQHPADIFVTPEVVRRFNLRDGQWIKGEIRRGGRGSQLHRLVSVNGDDPEKCRTLPAFDELTVLSPMERITLETTPDRQTTRIIDLFTPIGKGQRGIIVAPPRTGKTTFLQHIADSLVKNHPDITLIILLVDERPEEVTDIKRTVPTAEVMASSNDSDVKSHTRIAQLAIERAKRLVESGKDAFVLLDSITRVGRAFNNAMTGGGRTMSGGVDSRALEIPRRLFAAARNTEEAGSLTIIATALIETGSRMDDLIFQEFKGTGNMELVLDRKIADQRIYPAIDIFQSGTRREELLIPADDLHKINLIRRGLAGHKPMEAIERLLYFLRKFPTNAQMLREIPG